jgi:hypothetical protein
MQVTLKLAACRARLYNGKQVCHLTPAALCRDPGVPSMAKEGWGYYTQRFLDKTGYLWIHP